MNRSFKCPNLSDVPMERKNVPGQGCRDDLAQFMLGRTGSGRLSITG